MERIAVIGAGRMGIPMAQALALAGFSVDLADLKECSETAGGLDGTHPV